MMKKGTTTVVLNGKEYVMSFNFGVLKRLQKHTKGMEMSKMFEAIGKQDLEMFGLVAYYGIKVNHNDFTMDVIDELQMRDITNLFLAVGELINESMPSAEEEDIEEKK